MGDVRLKTDIDNLNAIFNSSVKNLINYHNSRIYGIKKSIMIKVKKYLYSDDIDIL